MRSFNKEPYFVRAIDDALANNDFSRLHKLDSRDIREVNQFGTNPIQYLLFKSRENKKSSSSFDDKQFLKIFNFLITFIPANSDVLEKPTTKGNFTLLEQAFCTKSEKIFFAVSDLLSQPIHQRALTANLLDFTKDDFGVLMQAILFGSEEVFSKVLALLQAPGHEKALANNLANFTKDNFGVLLSAIKSGSEVIVTKVLTLLQTPGREKALADNLARFNKYGFGVLMQAIKSGSEVIVTNVLTLLQAPGHEKALAANLATFNKEGFGVLMQAISSGSVKIVIKVLALLQAPGHEQALANNLANFTTDDFGVLQSAIKSGSEEIFSKVLILLQAQGNEKFLANNLAHFTKGGFGVLQIAIKSGSEVIFTNVLTLLQAPGQEKPLADNLATFTKEGFGVLQTAINSGSEAIVTKVLMLLQASGQEQALANNLAVYTKDGFAVLQSAIKSGSEVIVIKVLTLLRAKEHEKVLANNLVNFTKDGFGVLMQAIKCGSEVIVTNVLTLLQAPGQEKALADNLGNFTKDGFGVLQTAIKSGSEVTAIKVLTLLRAKGHERSLANNLANFTKDGYGVLQTAIKSGSEVIFTNVLTLLKAPGQEQTFAANLAAFTKDGFGVLQTAIKSGSEVIVNKLLTLLQAPGHEHALKRNLKAKALGKFRLLTTAANYLSDKDFNHLIQLSQSTLKQDWREILLEVCHSKKTMDYILNGAKPSLTKLKLLIAALNQSVGPVETKQIIKKHFQNLDMFILQGTPYSIDKLIQESADYQYTHHFTLIDNYLKNFANGKQDPSDLIAQRNFTLAEITDRNKDNRSLLWCLACAAASGYPEAMINIWSQFQNQFSLNDFIAKDSKSKNAFWYLLYACKTTNHPTQKLQLEAIIRTLWERYPQAFDVSYSPKSEKPERSVGGLLKQLGELGNNILLALTPPSQREALTVSDAHMLSHGGIAAKYLFGNIPLPKASHTASTQNNDPMLVDEYEVETTFKYCAAKSKATERTAIKITTPCFNGTYYGYQKLDDLKEKPITFVCAGRKDKALVPQSDNGVVVWVLTKDEYKLMQDRIPCNQAVLVIEELDSENYGEYKNLSLITSRRLGIFLFAHHCGIKKFAMLDDNIQKLTMTTQQANQNHWDAFYDKLVTLQQAKVCVSVRTHSVNRTIEKQGELGSKLFLINMDKLRTRLQNLEDLFSLFPSPANASLWGEDYYFQLMLEEMFPAQGYQIAPMKQINLVRSKAHKNAFANQQDLTTAIAKKHALPSVLNVSAENYTWQSNATNKLNKIIEQNIARARNKQAELERVDLLKVHAQANQQQNVNTTNTSVSLVGQDLKNTIKDLSFNQVLFPHQISAIQAVSHAVKTSGEIDMATGTGKTRVQCELARIAYHLAHPGECIVIVTPQLSLVEQFYTDFVNFAGLQTTNDKSLVIPKDAVVKISSSQDSVSVKALLKNNTIKRQKSILLFCEKSFKEFLPHWEAFHPTLCLLDEYHEYVKTTQSTIDNKLNIPKIGFTATPPETRCFPEVIYHYNIQQALNDKRLAPVLTDAIKGNYSDNAVTKLFNALPSILERYQPQTSDKQPKRLKDLKGLIYLPTVADCDLLQERLSKKGIDCIAVHSQYSDNQSEIDDFKKANKGILLACHMLRVGFDDKALGWVIIAQDVAHKKQTVEQMIGRVMRLNAEKIGYVITFEDIARVVNRIAGNFDNSAALSERYLMQNTQEKYNQDVVIQQNYTFNHNVSVNSTHLILQKRKADTPLEVESPPKKQKGVAIS